MYKILITGADGFIGRHLFKTLSSMDYDVWGLDNHSTSEPSNHPKIIEWDTTCLWHNWHSLSQQKFDIVIHLAALARIPLSLKNPSKYIDNNVTSTLDVLEYCRKNNSKLVVASSSTVAEEHDVNPYTTSKRMCEEMCKCYAENYGMNITVLRYFNVYGDGMATGSYATAIQKFLESDKIVINGDGTQKRWFTHVDDVVAATIMAMLDVDDGFHYNNKFKLYDVVNADDIFTINELAEMYNKPIEYNSTGFTGEMCQWITCMPVPNWKPKNNLKQWLKGKLQ